MSSSVPVALPAFKTLATTALPAGTTIWTGSVMPVQQSLPGDITAVVSGVTLLITGVHFDADEFAELGPNYKHEEHYNIECQLSAWAGDDNYDQRVQDVYALYADLSIAIGTNPRLGLTADQIRLAWPRQLGLAITPDALGRSSAVIDFQVQVQARVASQS